MFKGTLIAMLCEAWLVTYARYYNFKDTVDREGI